MQKRPWIDTLLLLIIVGALGMSAVGVYQYIKQPSGLIVRWSTENELEILGFNLYRAACGEETNCVPEPAAYQRLTTTPIRAQADPVLAADYEYVDEAVTSGTYAYLVETLYLDGAAERSEQPLILRLP